MDKYDFVDHVFSEIIERRKQGEFAKFSLFRSNRFLGLDNGIQVDNGGFDQFYFNFSHNFADQCVSALEKLGARKTAALVKEAKSVCGDDGLEKGGHSIEQFINRLTESQYAKLKELDDLYHSEPDNLVDLLYNFVIENK